VDANRVRAALGRLGQVAPATAVTPRMLGRAMVVHLEVAQAEEDDCGPLIESDFHERIALIGRRDDRMHATSLTGKATMQCREVWRLGSDRSHRCGQADEPAADERRVRGL